VTTDEHPEELLDRARQGALAPEAQAILNRHLADCSVCATAAALGPRFARELAPQPRDHLLYERAVEGALRRLQQSPPGWRRALPRWSRWAAAALLVIAGVTAAAAVIGRRIVRPAPPLPPVPGPQAATPRAPLAPAEAAPPEAPPPPEAPTAKPAPARHAAPRPPAVTADALFEEGEKLRREGHTDAAIATYRRLQTTFPDSPEARLSFAFGGQLLLGKGRPADALAQFDRHLKLDGEVGEEALAGRATALEQLHRVPEAIATWKSLLARYPRSIYVERARERLEQLTGHP
jgi:tetratricopeptide (TPR) repeat protein